MNQGLMQGLIPALEGGLNPSWASGRTYPANAAEWSAKHPTINAPTSIFPLQDASSPAADTVATNDLVAFSTPVFGATAEGSRLGVEFDSESDELKVASTTVLDPDGSKDMTYMIRCYIPTYSGSVPGIMAKRGGSGFPGWEIYLQADGSIKATQDGGASGRRDFANTGDYQNQWVDIAYVIEGTARIGRIETLSESVSYALTGVTSLSSTVGFNMGRSAATGRKALIGLVSEYCAVWDGTALTRAELLEIWA